MKPIYPVYDELRKDYRVTKIVYPQNIEEVGRLRYLAWKDVEGINKDFFACGSWLDEWDKVSHLWIIRYENIMVASARLSMHNAIEEIPWFDHIPKAALLKIRIPVASMNRLCVHPDFRHKGLTKPLDKIRISTSIALKAKTIIAEPVLSRFKTLEQYGFHHYGLFGSTMELPGVTLGFKMLNLD